MSTIAATLVSLPFTQLRRNRYFYVWYDSFYLVACLAALALMHVAGHRPLVETWSWPLILVLLPIAAQLQILCSVSIHNCTHNNFPRPINRLVGELCGIVVLTRFASWEVIHQRHHRYSDDVEKDPHPCDPSYWRYLFKTIANVERQLQQTYFELYGENEENRRYERRRAQLSYATNLLLIYTWYQFLGPIAFFALFVPSSLIGFFHLVHFNWSTHNAFSPTRDFKPVNLDHGFYRVGNKIWFGIYWHANHHKKTNYFNPARMTPSLPLTRPPSRQEREAADTAAAA
jgi:stearoyl-CoA desaturase (delta-9 desaturase)